MPAGVPSDYAMDVKGGEFSRSDVRRISRSAASLRGHDNLAAT